MRALSQEAQYVQNPALGGVLLWRFAAGYARGSQTASAVPVQLLFLVLPILLHERTCELVCSTLEKSGLRGFAGKFSASKTPEGDLLLAIHERTAHMRHLTLESLDHAVAAGLVALDCEDGAAVPLTSTAPKAGVPKSIAPMLRAAERLGAWCSAVSLHEVAAILKVGF